MLTRVLLAPPDAFDGTIADFVDEFVIPNAPEPNIVVRATESLLTYLEQPDAILLLRGAPRGHLHSIGAQRAVHCDNAPAIWSYVRCLRQDVLPEQLPGLINDGQVAVLMAATGEERKQWNFGMAMSTRDKQYIWKPHLKHCHIFSVKAPSLTEVQRAARNICPINHFLFPSPKWFVMQRIGWSDPNAYDLGECQDAIAVVFERLLSRLNSEEQRRTHRRFIEAAGATKMLPARGNLRIAIRRKQ